VSANRQTEPLVGRMKILALSSERALLNDENSIMNNTLERMKEYSDAADADFEVIVHSKGEGFRNVQSGRIAVYPTNRKGPISSYSEMKRIGTALIRKNGISCIFAQDPFAYGEIGHMLKKQHGLPLLVNVFSSFFDDPYWKSESLINRVFNETGKRIVRAADGVRVECETEKRKMGELGVEPSRVFVSPVLVDLGRFRSVSGAGVRKEHLGRGFDRIALYLGRLSKEKDVGTLLRAAKETWEKDRGILFLIVGSGPEEGSLKCMAAELGLRNVVFAGRIPYSEVPAYHAAADVFVLPSLYEGIPLVLVEAHASGKPVVCTELRDAPDVMLNGKSGYVVPQKGYREMAEKIIEILRGGRAEEMGEAGRAYVLGLYDRKKCLEKFSEVLHSTIASAKAGRKGANASKR